MIFDEIACGKLLLQTHAPRVVKGFRHLPRCGTAGVETADTWAEGKGHHQEERTMEGKAVQGTHRGMDPSNSLK